MKVLIVGVLIVALSLIFKKDIGNLFASVNSTEQSDEKKNNIKKDKDKYASTISERISIVNLWNLPEELNEVSGIAYIGDTRFACVQDEEGIIFIYNTAQQKIEKKVPFAGTGDYEGITLIGDVAFIVRADGLLYEVKDYQSTKPEVNTYKTPFSVEHNIEGLTYDQKGKRLLLAVKDKDLVSNDGKGVYAFDLTAKKLTKTPVYIISSPDALQQKGKKKKGLRPSAIGVHPLSNETYIVDGPKSQLLLLDQAGKLKELIVLGSQFAKPEGITFDKAGRMFISNERGKKSAANIVEVSLK